MLRFKKNQSRDTTAFIQKSKTSAEIKANAFFF